MVADNGGAQGGDQEFKLAREQTENRQRTDREQTENRERTEREQRENRERTEREQTENRERAERMGGVSKCCIVGRRAVALFGGKRNTGRK